MGGMRISGIASGMDTETMVRDLMKAERIKADKIKQSRQLSLWKQEQYNETNKSIAQFILYTKKELFGTSDYSKSVDSLTWVKKAVSSDESVFTATASAKAVEGTHKIKVHNLAEGVSVASKDTVKDKDGEIATGSSLIKELEGFTSGGTFKINDVDITVDDTTTIDMLVEQINSKKKADGTSLGIQASFDDSNGRLFLATKETGAKEQIKITDLEVDPVTKKLLITDIFKMDSELTNGVGISGKDAIIDFDGAVGLAYDSNDFSINGININLNSADPAKDITLKVDTDVDGVYDKIKGFVDKYNELIENLNKKTSEKRYRDFNPLTSEEKEAMKEDDIKLWEGKAKSGLLRNDQQIEKLVQKVRSGLYDPANEGGGAFDQLFEIGITTGNWKEKGKLIISDDPDKGLKAKIKEDPQAVLDLLFAPSDPDEPLKSGIVNRMYDDMVDGMKEIVNKAGTGDNADIYRSVKSNMLIDFVTGGNGRKGSISLLDEEIFRFDKSVSTEERRLSGVEERYWAKFSAMEAAMSKMQSQSDWLAGQMGGM